MTLELRPTPRHFDTQPGMTMHQYVTSQPFEEFLFSPGTQAVLDTKLGNLIDFPESQERTPNYMVRDVFATGQERFGKFPRLNHGYRRATLEAVQAQLPKVPLLPKPSAYLSGLMMPNLENVPAAVLWDNTLYGEGPRFEREISAKAFLEDAMGPQGRSESEQHRYRQLALGAAATFHAASNHATLQVMMRENGS